jgi:hypothetical protein
MGLLDRFRKPRTSFLGADPAAFPDDLAPAVHALLARFADQPPVVQAMGAVAVCHSPVLVVRDGRVVQPLALVPAPMLARFWTDDGAALRDDPALPATVARCAEVLARSDELARAALEDTEHIYVSDEAPVRAWPDQAPCLRLCSLVLADVVRKLAGGLERADVAASYGLGRAEAGDAIVRERLAVLRAEEDVWMRAAMATR